MKRNGTIQRSQRAIAWRLFVLHEHVEFHIFHEEQRADATR